MHRKTPTPHQLFKKSIVRSCASCHFRRHNPQAHIGGAGSHLAVPVFGALGGNSAPARRHTPHFFATSASKLASRSSYQRRSRVHHSIEESRKRSNRVGKRNAFPRGRAAAPTKRSPTQHAVETREQQHNQHPITPARYAHTNITHHSSAASLTIMSAGNRLPSSHT